MFAAALSHTIAIFAPWFSNWWRSSPAVYSGLCSTTTPPTRRIA